jgi:hypothetical protein
MPRFSLVQPLLVCLCLTLIAFAQTATLSGKISDTTGAAVANARVTLIAAGGGRVTATTDSAGNYQFNALKPGAYALRIEAASFRPFTREGVSVTTNASAQNYTLEVGGVAESLTITAQKIEEELGQAAVAVSVLGEKQFAETGVTDLNQTHEYVPNFRVTNTGGRATYNFVTLRGFINPAVGVDPSTAIYIDGVPQSDLFSLNQALFDVERVEVVKGPQGTLYGVNALAGVVNITSRRPTNDWHGGVSQLFGTYKSHGTQFNVAGPLVKDKLLFGFAGLVNRRDGFIRNVVTNRNYDDQFGYAGRARLIYNPTSKWDIALTLSGRKIDDKGGYIYLPTDLDAFNRLPTMTGFRVGEFEQALGTEGFNRANTPMGSLQVTRYGEAADVTYVGSQRKNVQFFFFDADLTPFPTFNGRFGQNYDEWYHEGRVQSSKTAGGKFNWLLERLRQLPGVLSAGATNSLPYARLDAERNKANLQVKGRADEELKIAATLAGADISAGYLEALRVPLKRGRMFDARDTTDAPMVVLLSERAAQTLFPDRDPIGQEVFWGAGAPDAENPYCTVVGVVGNVKHQAIEAANALELYYPYTQYPVTNVYYVIHTQGDPGQIIAAARQAVHDTDRNAAIVFTKTMKQLIGETLWQRRLWGVMFAAFAALALVLAAVGIYGVLSYAVTQRTREIGVRIALGATVGEVLKLVVTQGMKLVGTGVAVGLVAAFALTRLMTNLLFGVTANDPLTFAGVALLLALVALVACLIPARRAAQVDPMIALRSE